MKKVLSIAVLLLLCLNLSACEPRYIFYFIGDGMGINHVYATEKFNGANGLAPVNFFHFPVRTFVNTTPADGYVTDSAAGGSALATGTKVSNGAIAVSTEGQPLESLAQRAKAHGYGTGVISSGPITDATPAVFYAKAEKRGMSTVISEQLISSDIDFAAGPSFQQERGSDKDTRYWEGEAVKAGIRVFHGIDEYKPCDGRVLMLSNRYEYSLPYAIDRKQGDTRLADFTSAGIDHLYSNCPQGFFLMVEGAKTDYAAHANDAATLIREVNDLCESVDLALKFYNEHPDETLIVVVADHETGGFTMGGPDYSQNPKLLASQRASMDALTAELYALQSRGTFVGWPEVRDLIRDRTGLWDTIPVDEESARRFTQLYKEAFIDGDVRTEKNLKSANQKLSVEVISYVNRKSGFIFRVGSHTGAPLGLYVKGPGAAEFCGCIENSDVPAVVCRVTGI